MSHEFLRAAIQGDVQAVREMLSKDSALRQARDANGVSVILRATYHGQKEVVAALLNTGVELDVFEAAATGQIERLHALLADDASQANAYAPDGFTPLGLATFFGHPATVDVLLAAGADVNLASREGMKVTPLASAAAARHSAIAQKLIAHGADVNARSASDFTPLHSAAANGDLEMANLLLDHGAEINSKSSDGKTPLSFARQQNRAEMETFLVARGAAG